MLKISGLERVEYFDLAKLFSIFNAMAYVYRHIRLDKNEPFYIGIGADTEFERAFDKHKGRRSDWWFKVISKTGYRVDIILDNVTIELAKEKEIELIKLYGRSDLNLGPLVNMTDGGDGLNNRVFTPEYRRKLSEANKRWVRTDAHREKLRQVKLGTTHTPEAKEKIRQANLGKIISPENRALSSKRMTENNPCKGKSGSLSPTFKGYVAAYKDGVLFGVYEGVYDAGRNLNVQPTKVNACIKGRRKTTGGYSFLRIQDKSAA